MRAAREGVDERAGGERERWWGGRLSEVDWVRRVVGVEEGTGNLVVWGAPDVDHMGRVGDGGLPRRTGPRVA